MRKYLEVWIRNFQSIKDQTFELRDLTSIVGPTDRGKSAIYRALKSVFYNEWEDGFLRRGTKVCIIVVRLPDPYLISEIIQEKGKTKNSYTFKFRDGRKDKHIPKAGVKIPDEIKALGFEIVETDRGDKFNLNFHEQYDPLFLVVQPEPLVTSFINKIFKITLYEKALKKLTADSIKLNREYEDNNKVIDNKTIELQEVKKDFSKISSNLDQINDLIQQYDLCQEGINRCNSGIECFNKLNIIKQEYESLVQGYDRINLILSIVKNYSEQFQEYFNLVNYLDNLIVLNEVKNKLYSNFHDLENYKIEIGGYLNLLTLLLNIKWSLDSVDIRSNEINDLIVQDNWLQEFYKLFNNYYLDFQNFFDLSQKLESLFNLEIQINAFSSKILKFNGIVDYLNMILPYEKDLINISEIEVKWLDINSKMDRYISELEGVNEACKKVLEYESFVKSVVKQCPICDTILEE